VTCDRRDASDAFSSTRSLACRTVRPRSARLRRRVLAVDVRLDGGFRQGEPRVITAWPERVAR